MFAENLRHNYYWSSNAIRAIVLLQHYNYIGLKFQYNIGLLCVHKGSLYHRSLREGKPIKHVKVKLLCSELALSGATSYQGINVTHLPSG